MAITKKADVVSTSPSDLQVKKFPIKETEKTGAVTLLPCGVSEGELFPARIDQIVEISQTTIPLADEFQRPLDVKNLESLYHAKDEDIPPIEVNNSSAGYILVSGYHRKSRAEAIAFFNFHVDKGTWPIDQVLNVPVLTYATLRSMLVEADGKTLRPYTAEEQAVIDSTKIMCRAIECRSINELKRRTTRANTTHGKSLSDQQRSKYAYFEYLMAELEGRKFTYRDAGNLYGISHVAVMDYRDSKSGKVYIAKVLSEHTGTEIKPEQIFKGKVVPLEQVEDMKKQAETKVSSPVSPVAETPVSTVPVTQEQVTLANRDDEAARVAKAFFKAMHELYAGVKDSSVGDNVLYMRSFVKPVHIEELRVLGSTLEKLASAMEKEVIPTASERKNGK